MNKKNFIFVICLIIIFISYSGCLNNSKPVENYNITDNLPPIAKIIAPCEAYFGENIEFDASNSYDSDGNIISYFWDFGDGENTQGIKVSHSYKFENNFLIIYPIIYPVTLLIKDNKGTSTATTYQIKIYPKNYKLYLNLDGLTTEKPVFLIDKINSIIYELETPIIIKKCNWTASLYLEKPLFFLIKKITLTFFDEKGNVIIYKERKLGINIVWKEKLVKLDGKIQNEVEFNSLKLEIHGFLIKSKINIFYGGEKPSNICFDFTNI